MTGSSGQILPPTEAPDAGATGSEQVRGPSDAAGRDESRHTQRGVTKSKPEGVKIPSHQHFAYEEKSEERVQRLVLDGYTKL